MAWACERQGAGALRDLITVQRLKSGATRNSFGEVLQHDPASWETFDEPWAEIQPVGGDETAQPSQQVAVRRWRLRVRWTPATSLITPLMRVVLPEGTILNITRVADPDRQRTWMELDLKEAPANGT